MSGVTAFARILMLARLIGSAISGKTYFISQGEPRPLWDLLDMILHAAGMPPVTRHISPQLAYAAGWFYEMIYKLLRKQSEPPMTRFLARELSTAHWFNISAARRDLGYSPRVSTAEGLARLSQYLARERMQQRP